MIPKETLDYLTQRANRGWSTTEVGSEMLLQLITAAREFQLLKKCNGEDVIGGHEPIWHTDCCPLCTQIGDNNELRADIRINKESYFQLGEELESVKAELFELRSLPATRDGVYIDSHSVWVDLKINLDGNFYVGTLGEAIDAAKEKAK